MAKKEIEEMIAKDPNFIAIKRFDYSLAKLEERYPDGAPDHIIAMALQIPESEVSERFLSSVRQLRAFLKVEE